MNYPRAAAMQGKVTSSFKQEKSLPNRSTRAREAEKTSPNPVVAYDAGDGLSAEEQQLRQFDLATKYGPCVGMTRLERWERAEKFGLQPPAEVRSILMAAGGADSALNLCVWHDRV